MLNFLFRQESTLSILSQYAELATRCRLVQRLAGQMRLAEQIARLFIFFSYGSIMSRIRLLVLLIPLLVLTAIGRISQHTNAAEAVQKIDVTPAKPQRPITLRDRLVVGLQARLKSEVAFVEAVATNVQNGQLPQRQVDETFYWARQRAAMARDGRWHRPIIYFQPAMRARANLLRVSL